MRYRSWLRAGGKAAWFRLTALGALFALALVGPGEGSPVVLGRTNAQHGPDTAAAPASAQLSSVSQPPDLVPNAYPVSLTARVGTHTVRASWKYVDGMPGLNAQLDSWLLGALDAKTAPAGGQYRPSMALNTGQPLPWAESGTTLTAEPVQAFGTMIVVRETLREVAPNGTGTLTSATVYADTGTGEVHTAADLLRADTLQEIGAQVTGAAVVSASPPPAGRALNDMVLDPEGALQVTTPASGTVTHRADPVRVTVGAPEAGNVLSAFGRSVLDQIRAHTPAALPVATAPGLRHVNCDIVPCAALTYDDGPDLKTTPQLLGILKERNVQATFFMQGINAAANPGVAREVTDAGSIAGNHTFSHPFLSRLSAAGIKNEIDRAGAAVRAATGTTPAFMRPPYGDATPAVQAAVGLPLILWSVDSLDWQSRNPAVFVPKVLKEIKPGAVVLMHDVHATTIAGQSELVSSLQVQGYHLVTVPQLFEGTPLTAGGIYRSRPDRK